MQETVVTVFSSKQMKNHIPKFVHIIIKSLYFTLWGKKWKIKYFNLVYRNMFLLFSKITWKIIEILSDKAIRK